MCKTTDLNNISDAVASFISTTCVIQYYSDQCVKYGRVKLPMMHLAIGKVESESVCGAIEVDSCLLLRLCS